MRKGLRLKTTKESAANLKDFRKQIVTRTAQRKFAGNVQISSGVNIRESSQVTTMTPKTEDFLNFLCVRDAPHLPAELECFADPVYVNNPIHDEIFRRDDVESNIGIEEPTAKRRCFDVDSSVDNGENAKDTSVPKDHKSKPEMKTVTLLQPSDDKLKDFFQFMEATLKERPQHLIHLKPSPNWKCPSYVQNGLEIEVKTLHLHRLKKPTCENFMKLQCIRKQLEKDGVTMKDLPRLGLCEVDLPHLMDVVNSFGGVDSVNSDQNWRALADQLRIPKSASRRVSQLEKIYLKYILPYDLLPSSEKIKLEESVKKDQLELREIDKFSMSKKPMTLENFHRMACNALFYYCGEEDTDSKKMEIHFWKMVNEGSR